MKDFKKVSIKEEIFVVLSVKEKWFVGLGII